MKYIPILFSTLMVQAIIEGRKSMTRRKIKLYKADEHPLRQTSQWMQENNTCPYGKVGDVLWVRETWLYVMLDHAHDLLEGVIDRTQFVYKASVHENFISYAKEKYGYKWKPSLFMPKDACRIFLEITDIRVERLNDITNEQAIKEGIRPTSYFGNTPLLFCDYSSKTPINDSCPAKYSFETLWQSINGKDSWEENPWVWVISFKRIEKPANFC